MNLFQLTDLYLKLAGEVIQFPTCQGWIASSSSEDVPFECTSTSQTVKRRDSGKIQCDECFQAETQGKLPQGIPFGDTRGPAKFYKDNRKRNFKKFELHSQYFNPNIFWEMIQSHITPTKLWWELIDYEYQFKDCNVDVTTSQKHRDVIKEIDGRSVPMVDVNSLFEISIGIARNVYPGMDPPHKEPLVSNSRAELWARHLYMLGQAAGFTCRIESIGMTKVINLTYEFPPEE
jgi:hypothetical protein